MLYLVWCPRNSAAQEGLALEDQRFYILNGHDVVVFDGHGKAIGGMDSGIALESGSPLDLLEAWGGAKVGSAVGKAIAGKIGSAGGKVLNKADDAASIAGKIGSHGDDVAVSSTRIESLPKNVQDAYKGYAGNGWKGNYPGQSSGTNAGRIYDNNPKNSGGIKLPEKDASGNAIVYREFDVNSKISGMGRDSERFVMGSNGAIYYTGDHFKTFLRVE